MRLEILLLVFAACKFPALPPFPSCCGMLALRPRSLSVLATGLLFSDCIVSKKDTPDSRPQPLDSCAPCDHFVFAVALMPALYLLDIANCRFHHRNGMLRDKMPSSPRAGGRTGWPQLRQPVRRYGYLVRPSHRY